MPKRPKKPTGATPFGLPNSVPLFGTSFDVTTLTPSDQERLSAAGEKLLGYFDPEDQTIFVKDSMPPLLRLAVFFHELAHLRIMTTGIGPLLTAELEEAVSDWVGYWIAEMFSNGLLTWGTAARADGAS